MPRLSIVLVAYREQGFLRPCLDSVLGQAGDDLEVVVVDDASPDHSAEVLAEVAAADPRVHVHRLETRHGPDQARAEGLALATGEYVWFVDAADLLPEGALDAVTARLDADRPDVLVVDHLVREVDGAQHRPSAEDDAAVTHRDCGIAHRQSLALRNACRFDFMRER